MEQEKQQERSNILEIRDLNVFYPKQKKHIWEKAGKTQALFSVDLTMEEGEILGLCGESGCGKSTLAKTICGIHRDYEGSLIQKYPSPQMIFQDPYGSLNPARTVRWIMEEALRVDKGRAWTRAEREARVLEVAAQVELPEELLDRYPAQLSGGQRQRVGIGTALMQSPKLILADEPVSALDVTIQAQILKLLRDLHEKLGLSILFISHDLRVVYQICDHVMIMKEGKVVEYGETKEVYRAPRHEYTQNLLKAAGIREM